MNEDENFEKLKERKNKINRALSFYILCSYSVECEMENAQD